MRRAIAVAHYLLSPGLGLYYIGLMIAGGMHFGPYELEGFRIFGSPSMSNLAIEVPVAFVLGLAAALYMHKQLVKGKLVDNRALGKYVFAVYFASTVMYFLLPGVPE